MYNDRLEEVCNFILDFKFNEAVRFLIELLDDILKDTTKSEILSQSQLHEVIKFIEMSLTNKDYLFLYDLLQYELKPLLDNVE